MDGNMNWIKKLFGIKSEEEKKLAEVDRLQKLAFDAQRKGDLSLSGKYQLEIDTIYDEIEEMKKNNNSCTSSTTRMLNFGWL